MTHHESRAVGRRLKDITVLIFDKFVAGCRSHFHDGETGVGDAVAGFDGAVKRIDGINGQPFPSEGREHGLGESFAAISDRADVDLAGIGKTGCDGFSCFGGGEGSFEFVVGDENSHGGSLAGYGPDGIAIGEKEGGSKVADLFTFFDSLNEIGDRCFLRSDSLIGI